MLETQVLKFTECCNYADYCLDFGVTGIKFILTVIMPKLVKSSANSTEITKVLNSTYSHHYTDCQELSDMPCNNGG